MSQPTGPQLMCSGSLRLVMTLFEWPDERGVPWREVLCAHARRRDFGEARSERNPLVVVKLLIGGRDAVQQPAGAQPTGRGVPWSRPRRPSLSQINTYRLVKGDGNASWPGRDD
uniref:Uncharacterized protein n=1 Tax=Oryza glumipatula TaxID=40148 RepID=A0A0D9Z6G4_9ORYZ